MKAIEIRDGSDKELKPHVIHRHVDIVDIESDLGQSEQVSSPSQTSSAASSAFIRPKGQDSSEQAGIEESLSVEKEKRDREAKQSHKIKFYQMCFDIKCTQFPENHLAKFANIPLLYAEA